MNTDLLRQVLTDQRQALARRNPGIHDTACLEMVLLKATRISSGKLTPNPGLVRKPEFLKFGMHFF